MDPNRAAGRPPAPGPHAARVRSVAAEITRAAIAHYHAAREIGRAADALTRVEGEIDDDAAKWSQLAGDWQCAARNVLLRAVISWGADVTPYHEDRDPARKAWPARGVAHAGRLYLAVPDDDDLAVGERDPSGCQVMHLAVVELSAVVDLADVPPA